MSVIHDEYNPTLHYVEGPHNVIADTFSRLSRQDDTSALVLVGKKATSEDSEVASYSLFDDKEIFDSLVNLPCLSSRKKRKLETPEQANIRKKIAAEKMAEKRKMETPEQANIRKRKAAEKMAEKRKLETPEQANIRKKKDAEKKEEIRKLETPEQANIRKRKTAEKMAEIRKLETSQQHQNRIEKILDYSRSQKKGNNRKNPINGISFYYF